MRLDFRLLVILAILTVAQAVVFYDHFATSLTLLFAVGLGIWLRHWTAGLYALATFVIAFLLAQGTGWLHGARIWDLLLSGLVALLGGAVAGGIFQVIGRESAPDRPHAAAPPP